MKRFLVFCLFCGIWVSGWAQTRMIPHVTRAGGGFTTDLFLTNSDLQTQRLMLTAYTAEGQALQTVTLDIGGGVIERRDPADLWPAQAGVAFIIMEGSEQILVTAAYENDRGTGSPVQVGETRTQSPAWELFAGNWDLVFDGIALVNMGGEPTEVRLSQLDFEGRVLQQQRLIEEVVPRGKGLILLGSPEGSVFSSREEAVYRIEADQPLAITALRGDLPGARFLWVNQAVPREITAAMDLSVGPIPAELPGAFSVFSKYINVFGVHLFGSATIPEEKIIHAAHLMAQYLDNDEDGRVDDPLVIQAMIDANAAMIMFASEQDPLRDQAEENLEPLFGSWSIQDLQGDETHPGGSALGLFDAGLEEILHLIHFSGHANAYPDIFAQRTGSSVADAMDLARGGHFEQVPANYPAGAWYTYDDRSCDYSCQVTEYLYWAQTSILGAQEFPGRLEGIQNEWRLNTEAKVRDGDPAIYGILTDPIYRIPTVLPDGTYRQ